ncbi:hypothetical protein B0H15DRAFT_654081 [Mycena belliarum]|uniref:Uncharacterized protein n=1 Tax=Mycena belliarum TaxID=1033014 RepID=A0AAD6TTB3_9AGAR|nr:hypothetical protein B0H15DRAFT_654081 [Mycena belliae]
MFLCRRLFRAATILHAHTDATMRPPLDVRSGLRTPRSYGQDRRDRPAGESKLIRECSPPATPFRTTNGALRVLLVHPLVGYRLRPIIHGSLLPALRCRRACLCLCFKLPAVFSASGANACGSQHSLRRTLGLHFTHFRVPSSIASGAKGVQVARRHASVARSISRTQTAMLLHSARCLKISLIEGSNGPGVGDGVVCGESGFFVSYLVKH